MKYALTVINRIFYVLNRSQSRKISEKEFINSPFLEMCEQTDNEEDINTIPEFFSYEHFYVLYCRFYELDTGIYIHIILFILLFLFVYILL